MTDGAGRRGLILIAEDNDDLREIRSRWLVKRGFGVVEASNGGEAVEMCQREVPSLILIDLQMPVIDGITAIKFICRNARLRDYPLSPSRPSATGEWTCFSTSKVLATPPSNILPSPSLSKASTRYSENYSPVTRTLKTPHRDACLRTPS